MNFNEIRDFFKNVNEHTEQEILDNMPHINRHFRTTKCWQFAKEDIERILDIADKNKVLDELFKNEKKFSWWEEKLDFPDKLKFGVEIEVAYLPLDAIQCAYESNSIEVIMKILEVPNEISDKIIQNSEFGKKNEPNKWIFSREATSEESEASSPIMQNNVYDLNQIVAICTLLKALNAELHGGSGLHINVGADYLECNEKAIENLLKIWGECEELFFKIANPEGEVMRVVAYNMATPIKENIQDFFEGDGSVTLNTEEEMEKFLYQIQARNRMYDIVAWSNFGPENNVASDFRYAKTDEEKFKIYQRYEKGMRDKGDIDSKVRWTSINFNHMKWNSNNPGRIEIRIFNSSLEPEIIFQDLLLVGKMFQVSLENAKNPNYKKTEFEKLFLRNVTETVKVNNLLNLLFDEASQRKIFKSRWQSVRNNKDYKKYKSGRDTFEAR
jgi:hypothetical protein